MAAIQVILLIYEVMALRSIAEGLDLGTCAEIQGMSTGQIRDEDITASSYSPHHGPNCSRIRMEIDGGAWCPEKEVSKDSNEYLQIHFRSLRVITIVETQGRFGRGQGHEFTQQFLLEYQREEGGRWFKYTNRQNIQILQGNTNTWATVMRNLNPAIIALNLRFIPYSTHPRIVCMRVEVYGCQWQDGVVSYATYQGNQRGSELSLYDYTYDGIQDDHYLSAGLGQLTDGNQGESNFRSHPTDVSIKGFDWLGWRNDSLHPSYIPLIFKFDVVRNFSRVYIHCNNYFTKDIRVFKMAHVYFSVGGEYYLQPPLEYVHTRDTLIDYARDVIIDLNHHVGQYVKVHLYFDSKWMLISEVQFKSEPAQGTYLAEVPPSTPTPLRNNQDFEDNIDSLGTSHNNPGEDSVFMVPDMTGNTISGGRKPNKKNRGKNRRPGADGRGIRVDTGVVGIVKDLEVQHEQNSHVVYGEEMSESVREVMKTTNQDSSSSSDPDDTPQHHTSGGMDQRKVGIIIGVLLAAILMLFAISLFVILLHRRRKLNNNHQSLKIGPPLNNLSHHNGTLDLGDLKAATIKSSPIPSHQVYHYDNDRIINQQNDLLKQRQLPDLPPTPSTPPPRITSNTSPVTDISAYGTLPALSSTSYRSVPYHSPQYSPAMGYGTTYRSGTHIRTLDSAGVYANATTTTLETEGLYGPAQDIGGGGICPSGKAALLQTAVSIQGFSGATVYAVHNPELLWQQDISVMQIPRDRIQTKQCIGEGRFGEVHLCDIKLSDADDVTHDVTSDEGQSSDRQRTMQVAVKILRENADQNARNDFYKEMKILSQLRDCNIVQVLGVCTEGDPLCLVVEYMQHGDLRQFLLHHVPETNYTLRKHHNQHKILSYGCLVYITTQIASGMKYLESLNMVHRDLAARNCLVGSSYTIKISDFGMSRDLYTSDYYTIQGRATLPIRWMAWEAIILGKFSSRSDTWSFGVTLWEILTFGKRQPYDDLSDDEVIDNCNHYYRMDGLEEDLPQPSGCPKEIYDLMRECWNRDEQLRPSFREIHMFLQRKNMGYDPQNDPYCTDSVGLATNADAQC